MTPPQRRTTGQSEAPSGNEQAWRCRRCLRLFTGPWQIRKHERKCAS